MKKSVLIFLFFLSCNNHIQKNNERQSQSSSLNTKKLEHKENTTLINKLIDTLFSLPEVQQKVKLTEASKNPDENRVAILHLSDNSDYPDFYLFQVGYNRKYRFEPFYNFYIDKDDLKIKVYDPLSDTLFSIEDWRKKSQ